MCFVLRRVATTAATCSISTGTTTSGSHKTALASNSSRYVNLFAPTTMYYDRQISLQQIINIIAVLLQSLPDGEPTLVVSNYEKLDLRKLKHDIPRYTNSGVSVVQQQWWKAMIDMLELEQEACHQGGCWLLEELLQVKRTLAAQHTSVNQSAEAATLLHTMVSVERRDIPKVCSCKMHV